MTPSFRKRKIYTKKGDREKMMAVFNCKKCAVSYALNFQRDSLLSRKIRDYAINELKCMYRL